MRSGFVKKSILGFAVALGAVLPTSFIEAKTSLSQQGVVLKQGEQVARIKDVTFASLDEAIAQAKDNDVIEVLTSCTTNGLNLSKNLTIKGVDGTKPTISFVKDGIALWGKTLKFENCKVIMQDVEGTPYSEWKWMTICASVNSNLELNNAELLIDGKNMYAKNKHAIYFTGNNKLNLNNSTLKISNYKQDALEWDGGDVGYNVNFKNSTFVSDHNRSGFTGKFYATFDHSNVKVINSTGNGSNGTYYDVKNNSEVLFQNNRNWGMSGYYIDVTNHSTIRALDNGYSGIWVRALNVDGTSTLDIQRNGNHSQGSKTNAGLFFQGNGARKSVIEKGAKVTIKDNAGSGIYTKQGICNMTINTDAIITNNGLGLVDTYNHYGAKYGGGIYNVGTMVLCDDVVLYNNHASDAGDDIYSTKKITFGEVGNNWSLDGGEDCSGLIHAIDGWYDDCEKTRWNAHDENLHVVKMAGRTYEGTFAFKAAHGEFKYQVQVNYLEKGTNAVLQPAYVSEQQRENTAYDVSKQCSLPIEGYTFVEQSGDVAVGTLTSDKVINVYYVKNKYQVDYKFVSGTKGKELDKEIIELLPSDLKKYEYGTKVNAIQPTKLEVKVKDGVWKFTGYDQEVISKITKNETFIGTWEFVETIVEIPEEPTTPDQSKPSTPDQSKPTTPDQSKPTTPGTGDHTKFGLYAGISVVALGIIAILVYKNKTSKE